MATIQTRLTTSGNSKALRLPKAVLQMSQLGDNVELEVRRGEIVIRDAKDPRAGWSEQIRVLLAKYGDPADEFGDLTHLNDDLDELTWDGPSFEEWRQGAKD